MESRAFCITDFELDLGFWMAFWRDLKPRYLLAGEETCPSTGKTHWQMYLYFNSAKSYKKIKRLTKPRHIEICHGSPGQNHVYCTKENIEFEWGNRPAQGKRSDLTEIRDMIDNGSTDLDIAQEHFGSFIRYNKGIEKYRSLKQPKRNWKTKVIILWGAPGTGKTREAFEAGGTLVEYTGSFFLGYENQKIVILDDFDPATMDKSTFLKITDRYPLKVNVKFGQMEWNPKILYITSNYDPSNWYGGGHEIIRRIDENRQK